MKEKHLTTDFPPTRYEDEMENLVSDEASQLLVDWKKENYGALVARMLDRKEKALAGGKIEDGPGWFEAVTRGDNEDKEHLDCF